MENNSIPATTQDALIPAEMARKSEQIGVIKANLDFLTTFMLAVLAGGFIALGAIFATTVTAGTGGSLSYGITRLLGGLVFCLGLILVVIAGAELFTGNNLIVMAWASRKVSTRKLLRNWGIVYTGNLAGSLLTALLVALSGQYQFGGGAVGVNALNIAAAKVNLGFTQALILGILCNALVCLAVWLTLSARSVTDKILAVLFPITAFVAAGFEHSVANMYFIPVALMIEAWAPASFWRLTGIDPFGSEWARLNWGDFLFRNLLPVTIGNIIGGALMVGAVYWLIYLRNAKAPN
jgi:formate transporter FocA